MKTAITTQTSMLAALVTALNTGYIRLYDGTEPSTPETALSSNTLLAELTFGATSGVVSGRVFTANAITQDSSADAAGTPTFYRAFASDGTTVKLQGTVGLSAADMIINAVPIASGAPVSCSSFTYTLPQ